MCFFPSLGVTECDFMLMKPSMIATSCIISAIKGLKIKIDSNIIVQLCTLTNSEVHMVLDAVNRLEWIVAKEASLSVSDVLCKAGACPPYEKIVSASVNSGEEKPEKPETPTDVQDVDF